MAAGGDLGFYIGSYTSDANATAFLTSRGYAQALGYEYWDSVNSQLKKWDGTGWGVITGTGATSPWTESGGVVSTITPASDDVVVGAAAMSAGERLRVVGGQRIEKSDSAADDALLVQVSGSHPTTERAVTIDVDVADLSVPALLIDSEVDNTSLNGSPLIQLEPLNTNPRGDIAFANARTGDPTSPSKGDLWWNTTAAAFKYYDGVSVQTISVGGTSPWSEAGAPAVLYPTTYATDDVAIGINSMFGAERLRVLNTDTSGSPAGIWVGFDHDSGSIGTWVGVYSEVDTNALETEDITTSEGFYSRVNMAGASDIDTHISFYHVVNTGTASNVIKDCYGLRAASPLGSGSITNAYGVYVDAQNGGTRSYGIYQAGTGDVNAFLGDVAVGIATMAGAEHLRVHCSESTGSPVGIRSGLDTGGSLTRWEGVRLQANINSGHTVGSAVGLFIDDWTGSGTISGNAYGIYIANLEAEPTVSGTAYGVFQEDDSQVNYFAGDVGIGTTTLTAGVLTVRDNNDSTTQSCIEAQLNKTGTGTITTWRGIEVDPHVNAGTVSTMNCIRIDPPSGSGAITSLRGLIIPSLKAGPAAGITPQAIVQQGADDVNRFGGRSGFGAIGVTDSQVLVDADYTGAIVATRYAVRASLNYSGAGTTLSAGTVYDALVTVDTGETITNAYGFYVRAPTGSGTISACYGVYIEGQETGPTTLGFGIYQAGTSDINNFAADTSRFGPTASSDQRVDIDGGLRVAAADYVYFGPSGTDGTWRMGRSGNDFIFQRRESGSYVTKSTISA